MVIYLVFILISLVKLLIIFAGVAFFTLLERKILRYRQNRKGPNKVGILGIIQPIADAIKLIFKKFVKLFEVNIFEFIIFPFFSLILMIKFWIFFSKKFSFYKIYWGILIIFVLLSLRVFPILGSGWRSKRKYRVLGALRGAAQRISYEVVLVFILIWVLFFVKKFFLQKKNFNNLRIFFFWVFFIWLIIILCETNRAPFDFAEGERELVSGFKIEYGSIPFVFLFLSEYGIILFLSVLTSLYFFLFFEVSFFVELFQFFFYEFVFFSAISLWFFNEIMLRNFFAFYFFNFFFS